MGNLILFPSSFYSTLRVDEDLQSEYAAVVATGLYDVVFFDYHKWFDEGKLMLSKKPTAMQKAIMRGWRWQCFWTIGISGCKAVFPSVILCVE